MTAPVIKELRTRSSAGTRVAPMVTAHGVRALNVADSINAIKATHASNSHLSDAGRAAKTREDAGKLALRLNLSRAGIEHERATRKSERDALVKTTLSPFASDALQSEIRAALKALPHGEVCVLAAKDPRVLAAIAAAPQIVTGIRPEVLAQLTDAYLENNHAVDFERAKKRDEVADEAFAVASAALTVAENALYQAAGFPHTKAFEDWRYEVAKPTAAQLEAEAAGRAAPGLPAFSTSESLDVGMDTALAGMPK
jgi:hypothetical protein